MYFNMFGGSAFLHVLAAHPKVVAAFGIAATVAMLASPLGRSNYARSERYARQLDTVVAAYADVDDATVETATRASDKLHTMPDAVIHQAVREMLAACGSHCAELTPMIVERQPKLLSKALFVHELNVLAAQRDHAVTRTAHAFVVSQR
jgi:hypothetical protein